MTTKRKYAKVEKYHDDVLDDLLQDISLEEQEQTNYKMMLAAKIDKAIEARGWNGVKFAEVMGKRPSEISKWLSGKHNFTVETLWAIEKVLNINLVNLQEEKDPYGFVTLGTYIVELNAASHVHDCNFSSVINFTSAESSVRRKRSEVTRQLMFRSKV
jgi:transcriptional regulator with XRE-family HTH domain